MSEDAIDLKYAKQVADYISSDHTEIYMTPNEVITTLDKLIQLLGTYDITTIRASMGMYLICKECVTEEIFTFTVPVKFHFGIKCHNVLNEIQISKRVLGRL